MRTRSKAAALVVATTTIAAVVTVAAPALAAGGDTITGGCFANVHRDTALTNQQNQGILGDLSVTRDLNGPVSATVTCFIEVNGTEAPGTRLVADGDGVQANATQIAYAAGPTDVVELCQDVHFADGFDTGLACSPTVNVVVVPDDITVPPVNRLFPDLIDPLVCPTLGGDLIVLGVVIYDCPPYND